MGNIFRDIANRSLRSLDNLVNILWHNFKMHSTIAAFSRSPLRSRRELLDVISCQFMGYWRAFQRSYAARLWITLWLTTKFLTPPSFSVNRSQQPVLDLYIFTGVWKATYSLLIFNLYTAYPVIQRVFLYRW